MLIVLFPVHARKNGWQRLKGPFLFWIISIYIHSLSLQLTPPILSLDYKNTDYGINIPLTNKRSI